MKAKATSDLERIKYLRLVFCPDEEHAARLLSRLEAAKGIHGSQLQWKNHCNVILNPFYTRKEAKRNVCALATVCLECCLCVDATSTFNANANVNTNVNVGCWKCIAGVYSSNYSSIELGQNLCASADSSCSCTSSRY
jgi:hypothetical protein